MRATTHADEYTCIIGRGVNTRIRVYGAAAAETMRILGQQYGVPVVIRKRTPTSCAHAPQPPADFAAFRTAKRSGTVEAARESAAAKDSRVPARPLAETYARFRDEWLMRIVATNTRRLANTHGNAKTRARYAREIAVAQAELIRRQEMPQSERDVLALW